MSLRHLVALGLCVPLAAAAGAIAAGLRHPHAPSPEPGVSKERAERRARRIGDLRYELQFRIPDALDEPILGSEVIRFTLRNTEGPLILDFQQPPEHVQALQVGGRPADFDVINGHVVLPATALREGENEVAIEFIAGDGPLNRTADYLYTLFVPGRASEAFPSFDQPDLKARWTLTLDVPSSWQAVANGAEIERRSEGGDGSDRTIIRFAPTEPISSYLFSFAAGRFQIETAERDGRVLRMFHRETDTAKVARNRDAIFDLHARALAWLEDYTGVPYPFGKFDFVLIPSFQYGGMEHPGAILYRDSGLLLEESATQNQLLGRASVIAHETAHMWFGDLVTMKWFDDVWTKEVFANFMAAKIVHPSFPQIDHDLRFLLAHHPDAYDVDRTAGANPIGQELDNLSNAGALYGAIIYQKAPIVMRKLERIVGEDAFRAGLQEYLETFAFSNATWDDLIRILDRRTARDLAAWSRVWVEEPGRPLIEATLRPDDTGRIAALTITQADVWDTAGGASPTGHAAEARAPAGRRQPSEVPRAIGRPQRTETMPPNSSRQPSDARQRAAGHPADRDDRLWPQELHVQLGYGDSARVIATTLEGRSVEVSAAVGLPAPDYVLPNAGGIEYGLFRLDPRSRAWLLQHVAEVREPVARGAAWLTLWDAVLEGDVAPADFLDAATLALPAEDTELLVQQVLGYTADTYWRLLTPDQRRPRTPVLEALLWRELEQATSPTLKSAYFNAFRSMALSADALDRLEQVWAKRLEIPGLTLSEPDFTELAQALVVHEVAGSDTILAAQLDRIENPDRRARFAFVTPALSADPAVRDSFFRTLEDPANRRHEPWVLEGMRLLHHPLRAASAVKYIAPSLELVDEIRRTGDIFFPKRWLDVTLGGHSSEAAAEIVRAFLADHPDYPADLRAKILQSADGLFRSARARRFGKL